MANYSAIKAAVNAYIKQNGKKEITGHILNSVLNATIDSLGRYFQFAGGAMPTDDPGTPDQNVCYLAGEPGVYTNFGGITIENEEVALLFWDGEWTKRRILIGIREVNASVDNRVGTPSVDVSYSGGQLVLTFHNLKGETGDAAGFGTIGADINGGVGTPGVSVESSGDNTAKNLMFHFTNLKGETGVTSVVATIDDTSGTPSCQVSLVDGVLTLAFSGLKGLKGDTGVSADYPITIYNGLDSDATDQALAAAQGKVLDEKISQLQQEVEGTTLSPSVTGKYAMLANAEVGQQYEFNSVVASSFGYWVVPCAEGDVFLLTTKGNSANAKAYAILDGNNIVLALQQQAVQDAEVTIPLGGKSIIVNSNITGDYSVFYKNGKIAEIKNEVADARNVPLISGGYYSVGTIGNVAKYVSAASMSSRVMKVSEGDVFNISGLGSSGGRLWATLSSDNKVVRNAPSLSSFRSAIVTIAAGEKYLVINSYLTAYPKCEMVKCAKYATDTRDLLPILPEVIAQKLDYIKEIYVSPNYTEGWEHMYLNYIVKNEGNYRVVISNATSSSASGYVYANRILTEKPVGPIALYIGQGAERRESGIYVVVDWDLAPSGNITINAEIYSPAKDAYLSPSCYAYYKNAQLSLYVDDTPMFSLIDDDFAVPAKCEILANICEELGIRCNYALIPTYDSTYYNPSLSEDKKAKVVELMERGHEFVMHPNHQLFYGADGTTQGTPAECEKNLVQTRRFFDENGILNGSEYLVWPVHRGLLDELLPMSQRQVKLAIHSGAISGVYVNNAGNFARYRMVRESLFNSTAMDKALVKSQIDAFAESGKGWCIFVMHSHWLTNDNIVDNTSNTFANLREILEYALSKNISFVTIHEGYQMKVLPEYLPQKKLHKD